MKCKTCLSAFIILMFLYPPAGVAFVPQTPHLLHMVVQKIKQPSGLEVQVTRTVVNCDDSGAAENTAFSETLRYQFPGRFRSDLASDPAGSFGVESGFEFIRVEGGETVSREKSPIDLYTDILLYRDHETLLGQLALTGIDVSRVSFQRYEGTICWVVGQPGENNEPFAGLWVEKDTFLPLKYAVEKNGWMIECRYSNWQRISRTWYPMQVSIFLDNQLYAHIDVSDIRLESGFEKSLFDIARIERMYPEKIPFREPDQEPDGMDEINRRIEEFKKLYE